MGNSRPSLAHILAITIIIITVASRHAHAPGRPPHRPPRPNYCSPWPLVVAATPSEGAAAAPAICGLQRAVRIAEMPLMIATPAAAAKSSPAPRPVNPPPAAVLLTAKCSKFVAIPLGVIIMTMRVMQVLSVAQGRKCHCPAQQDQHQQQCVRHTDDNPTKLHRGSCCFPRCSTY